MQIDVVGERKITDQPLLRAAVPFWGQSTQLLTGLSPKPDCGSKRVSTEGDR